MKSLKRYPFSKKVVQAILAATLILTPVAGVGAAQTETVGTENTVNAAAYNKGDLVTKFNKVYSALKRNDDLQKIKNAQAEISKINWNTYADRILNLMILQR